MEDNIFSSLFKWGDSTKKPEDYYTKSLSLVLSHLLNSVREHYKIIALDILNSVFAIQLGFKFDIDENIVTKPHRITKKETTKRSDIPDITIKTENDKKLILVEIKVDSRVDKEACYRLKKYNKRLSENKKAKNKGLILVTKFGDARVDSIIPPKQQISWFTLSGVMRNACEKLQRSESTQSATTYLLETFCEFLKESDMTIEKVENNFDPTTLHNVSKLLRMLEVVCRDKELNFSKNPKFEANVDKQAEESWLGYSNRDCTYAIGIYATNPAECHFEIHEGDEIKRLFANKQEVKTKLHKDAELWEWDRGIAIAVKLDLGSRSFSGQDVSEAVQASIVKNFIKEILEKWEKLKKTKHERDR